VVQFAYGEDGLDVTARAMMREFGFLALNADRFAQQVDPEGANRAGRLAGLAAMEQQAYQRSRSAAAPVCRPAHQPYT
jgi:DNA-directed RNA polymerase I subunit RPA1